MSYAQAFVLALLAGVFALSAYAQGRTEGFKSAAPMIESLGSMVDRLLKLSENQNTLILQIEDQRDRAIALAKEQ